MKKLTETFTNWQSCRQHNIVIDIKKNRDSFLALSNRMQHNPNGGDTEPYLSATKGEEDEVLRRSAVDSDKKVKKLKLNQESNEDMRLHVVNASVDSSAENNSICSSPSPQVTYLRSQSANPTGQSSHSIVNLKTKLQRPRIESSMTYMRRFDKNKRNQSAQLFYGMIHGGISNSVMK